LIVNTVFCLPRDAICELELIQLELKYKRHVHLRDFIDRYYCHKHSLLKRTDSPNWNGTLWQGTVSKNAWDAYNNKTLPQAFSREHVVPIDFIGKKLMALPNQTYAGPSLVDIANLADKYLLHATITKAENVNLNKGLKSTMPSGFNEPGNVLFEDLHARYKEKKIAYGNVSGVVYTHIWGS
jgi:hypothetical protein